MLRRYSYEKSNQHHISLNLASCLGGWMWRNTIRKNGGIYSHNKKDFKVGDTVSVKYNPDDPGEFLENGKSYGIGFGGILIVLGLVAIVGAFTQL